MNSLKQPLKKWDCSHRIVIPKLGSCRGFKTLFLSVSKGVLAHPSTTVKSVTLGILKEWECVCGGCG